MKYFLLFSLSLGLLACGTSKDVVEAPDPVPSEEPAPPETEKPQKNAQVKSSLGSFEESDALDIDSLRVEGNKLFIYVRYNGGCREHQFKMIGSPVVMKSLPAKRIVQLVHDNELDPCKSIVSRVLEVDLKELAMDQTPGSTIILVMKEWTEEITYTYE